ncbi:hypothetical protein LTR10_019197 [Elasticomyces elasticus]|uniref:BRCT domain-containing protein n=1 Tax=Exophiala sideris TaxID=1016849 RepID=A0ABR0JPG9_9EURO|nr:hypothetical protein LTR10_019197 [Elasticomyces elasticus]KAK5038121.1 hypothetical protein LTS07_001590 [Exophiala sideris]KAK5044105.1 hypothetical protein LTR13_000461 [Exophiala sideris]KAK5067605.1 hypothetical protein LTR69_001594 [Exophiala sideris]KAK5184156.1 hypothetical protein LTR44_003662 [Eurotiomycetes sp. CCFEE 6388]
MGKTFRNIVLASTGDFGDKSDKIKNWVEHAGGRFTKEITKDVTHLVASQRAWKKYHPMVKEARRLRSIHIVKLDWLEDSLTSKTRRPLETAKYAFEQRKVKINKVRKRKRTGDADQAGEEEEQDQVEMVTQNHIDSKADVDDQQKNKRRKTASNDSPRETKTDMPRRRKQHKKTGTMDAVDCDLSKDARIEISAKELENECTEFQKELGEIGYRPFTDGNGFTFLITLLRKDILNNRLERHRLKVRYAPYFSSQPATFYTICNQAPDRRRKLSDEGYFPTREYPVLGPDMDTNMSLRPTLPPCPVPLYFFPKPFPYSHAPVVATSLPKYLQPSNPSLRVHIPNPWAQTLQLFEYDPALNPKETMTCFSNEPPRKSYACYTVYTRHDQRYVSTLAPPGSTFDFAFAMFSKFFQKRVGMEWSERQNASNQSTQHERNMCGDGAGDAGFFEFFGPVVVRQTSTSNAVVDSVETRQRKPSVTMLVNCLGAVKDELIDVKAKTPDEGW